MRSFLAAILSLVAALLQGCAALDADVHLAPFWTQMATSNGAVEREAAGGMYFERFDAVTNELQVRALKPIWGWRRVGVDEEKADFLVPLGYWRKKGDSTWAVLVPLFYWRSAPADWAARAKGETLPEGAPEREFDLLVLPGLIWSRNARGANKVGLFPIYGELDKFLTWDRVRFFLFPLYVSARRGNSVMHNVLFPVFGWEYGGAGSHWRVWPLVGRNAEPGKFDRWFVLWPIGHWSVEGLWKERANRKRSFAILPLYGRTAVGTYRSHSFLWPFFGFAYDPRGATEEGGKGAFWAWDGPWPFVRLQGGGLDPNAEERFRIWPFYGYFRGDGMTSRTYAWPIVHDIDEDTPGYRRASFYVLPFYQQWDLRRPPGSAAPQLEAWRRVWPLWRYEQKEEWRRTAVFSLDPLMRSSVIDFHFGWLWEVMAWETDGPIERERAWLGLYRRESSGVETRWSVTGLWSERTIERPDGLVSETSFLFGLLRWRSGPPSCDPGILMPALPGPGWPREFERPAVP
ncbi:MAG: hypothetical protein R3F34_16340 [Planctomycetota bacterium]